MISNHSTNIDAQRPMLEALAAMVDKYLAAGGKITEGESPSINPLPPVRSNKIDPDTVLKRKPKALSAADRKALRKMADSL